MPKTLSVGSAWAFVDLTESEKIQMSGMIVTRMTTIEAMPKFLAVLSLPAFLAMGQLLPPARSTLKPRTNANAMSSTKTKRITDMVEPMPISTRLIVWL